jgi:hypothetical protein
MMFVAFSGSLLVALVNYLEYKSVIRGCPNFLDLLVEEKTARVPHMQLLEHCLMKMAPKTGSLRIQLSFPVVSQITCVCLLHSSEHAFFYGQIFNENFVHQTGDARYLFMANLVGFALCGFSRMLFACAGVRGCLFLRVCFSFWPCFGLV